MSSPETLNPRRFTSAIGQQAEFLGAMPTHERFSELDEGERRHYRKRAIAAGAIAHAHRLEKERGEYDLDANLFKLVAGLEAFYVNQSAITDLTDDYDNPRHMPPKDRQKFYRSKDALIEFNDTLHEVINVGASKFNFHELLTFMTNMHVAAGGHGTAARFQEQAREALIGMRNEVAFEQILIANGIDFTPGTTEQDKEGGDVEINKVLIDVKASWESAARAKQKAAKAGRNPNLIIWSHIEFEDFEGQLTLPYAKTSEIFAKLKPDLARAVPSLDQMVA